MLLRENVLFVIMPTGYGKTDMVLLTAFIEQSCVGQLGKALLSLLLYRSLLYLQIYCRDVSLLASESGSGPEIEV